MSTIGQGTNHGIRSEDGGGSMRFVIITFFAVCVAMLTLAFAELGAVSADSSAKGGQWQYQCLEAKGVTQVTERANTMGEEGWELVTAAGMKGETLWCFKRPLWKPRK